MDVKPLIDAIKWIVICSIAIIISNFIIDKLMISNNFLIILLTALFVSIVIQAVKSHEHEYNFRMKWFFFYFIVYSTIIWFVTEYIFLKINTQNPILLSILLGIILAIAIILLKKINIKSKSIYWIILILISLLVVANLGNIPGLDIPNFTKSYQNSSKLNENEQICPTTMYNGVSLHPYVLEANLNPNVVIPMMDSIINKKIWKIESNIRSCYKGKYQDQNPQWYYCDDMIVSRWEINNAGTIDYRWYTAVSAIWIPEAGSSRYMLNGFSCENGQKLIVKKGEHKFYVHDTRSGTQINIDVSGDETPINLAY